MPRTPVAVLLGGALVATSLAVVVGATAPAYAVPAGCSATTPTCTVTFGYTGGEQTFVVPAGVSSVQVTAVGAAGGGNYNDPDTGGRGASVSGSIAVTAGSTLYVEVGEHLPYRTAGPAFNGGGAPGYLAAGAGGGASDVRSRPSSPDAQSLLSRLLVAGGGGGGGERGSSDPPGGDAGSPGVPDPPSGIDGGGGGAGKADAGGAGGLGGADPRSGTRQSPGATGSRGQGGAGSPGNPSGGGGGGGVFGGGGGGGADPDGGRVDGTAGSGGGGSSLVPPGGSSSLSTDPASVTISYDRTVVAPTIPATTSTTYGTSVQVTATLDGTSTPDGATFAFTLGGAPYASCASVPAEATPQAGDNAVQATCSFGGQEPGSYSVQAAFSGNTVYAPSDSNTATLTVDRLSQSVTFTSPAPSGATVGDGYTATATATAGGPVTFSSATPAVCTVSSAGAVALDHAGTCTVQADQAGSAHDRPASAQQSFTVTPVPVTPAPVTPTPVPPTADLGISFTSKAPDWAPPGTIVKIELRTTDAGPDGATSSVTTLTLPRGWRVRRASDDAVVSHHRLTVTGDLAAGSARSTFVVLRVGHRPRATLRASVASAVADPSSADNTDRMRINGSRLNRVVAIG